MLFRQPVLPAPAMAADRLKAGTIIRVHQRLGYTAVGVAPRDLAGGLDLLRRQRALPWISLNLVDDRDRPVFPARVLATAGDLRVAILGLTGPARNAGVRRNDHRILDWEDALPPALAQARKEADMVILLSSYPFAVNERIARREKGIALILQAGDPPTNMAPRLVADTLVCRTGSRGKYLGVLDITWRGGDGWHLAAAARRSRLRDRLQQVDRQIGQLKKRASGNLEEDATFRRLAAARNALQEELRGLAGRGKTTPEKGSTYSNRFIALKTTLPGDREVEAMVRQTLRQVNNLNRQRARDRNKERAEQLATRRRLFMLTGSGTCSGCHPRQAAFWRRTRHAAAWQTLAARQRQNDRDCLPCHITMPTGALEQAGMRSLPRHIPVELRAVGCEACHGPGRRHADNPAENRLRPPDASTCSRCHRSEHDPAFSLVEKLPRIRCPQARESR